MAYSKKRLIEGIFSGEFSKFNLPDFLFLFTFTELIKEVDRGFGGGVEDLPDGSVKLEYADAFRFNINLFSGAKTFQEINDLSKFVFDENGFKRPFKEFRELAYAIDDKYNKIWLKTEQDTAFGQAQSAESWIQYEEEKDIFPLLQYQTADDERVRHEHAAWDNLIFPVGHEFWDTRMPVNGYNCRCRVIQLRDGKTSGLTGIPDNSETLFSSNVGKTKEIFTDKHPYYKINREDRNLSRNNFGLGFL